MASGKKRKLRLDELLVARGLFADADAALRAVLAREVRVDDVYAASAAIMVPEDADIFVKGRKAFVSRGGYKLQGAIEAFGVSVEGARCCDVGSSTGGFTDCLLQAGAASVACVDVNYGQLAWKVRQDPRVSVFERTNVKLVSPESLGGPFDLVVVDVSFIGLAALAGVLSGLCGANGTLVALVKPQFESRHDETERGVVKDEAVRARTVGEVEAALEAQGFSVRGSIESPIRGAQGNVEYLLLAVK